MKSYMKDPKTATLTFDQKYWGKGVQWRGYVTKVGLNDDDVMSPPLF
jgi:hypothetical protein